MWLGMLVGLGVCMGEAGCGWICWWVWLYVWARVGMSGCVGGFVSMGDYVEG